MEKVHPAARERSLGDAAVEGLVGGLIAGTAMAILLVLLGMAGSSSPAVTLGYFDPMRDGDWLTGLITHLAVSAVYGTLFGFAVQVLHRIRPSILSRTWLLGMVYALMLYLAAIGLIFRAVDAQVIEVGAWQFGLAHLLYGLVLGSWLGRDR